jgi:hypothetical protein
VVSVLPQAAKLTVFEEIKREMNSRLEQSFSLNLRAHQGTFLFSLSLPLSISIADPGSGAFLTPGSGSGMNIPDHIFQSWETIFGLNT